MNFWDFMTPNAFLYFTQVKFIFLHFYPQKCRKLVFFAKIPSILVFCPTLPKNQEKLEKKCKIKKVSFVKVVFYCFHNNRNNRALTLIFSHLLTENLFIDTSVKF